MNPRYTRQTVLKEFAAEGQAKLASAKVLVVGLGGLGLPILQYLNAMGVGTLGLMDQDVVELHNLQRQILYTEKDLGVQKLDATHQKLSEQNSETALRTHDSFLIRDNALDIIKDYDLVVDATDNFATRYLINDACVILKKPFVYGALHGFEGHVSVFNYNDGPTYRCLYPTMPTANEIPDCNENGVLGVIPGIIGSLQALEVVKLITGMGEVLSSKLLVYNGLNQQVSKISFNLNPENKNIKNLQQSYESKDCAIIPDIAAEVFQTLRESGTVYTLIDVRTPEEFNGYHLEEALNIPLNAIQEFDAPSNQNTIYLICQSGARSAKALEQLQQAYPNLTFCHILGGMNKMMALCP